MRPCKPKICIALREPDFESRKGPAGRSSTPLAHSRPVHAERQVVARLPAAYLASGADHGYPELVQASFQKYGKSSRGRVTKPRKDRLDQSGPVPRTTTSRFEDEYRRVSCV